MTESSQSANGFKIDPAYQRLFDTINTVVGFVTPDERYIYMNKTFEDWFGKPRAEMLGRPLRENLGPKIYEARAPYIKDALQGKECRFNIFMPFADGHMHAVENHYLPHLGSDGEVLGFFVHVIDLKSVGRLDEVHYSERSRIGGIINRAGFGLWTGSLPLGAMTWDETAKEHAWIEAGGSVSAELLYERMHPEDHERFRIQIAAAENDPHFDIEFRTLKPGASKEFKWIRVIGRPDYGISGQAVHFEAVSVDISPQKLTLSALHKSETQFRMLANSMPQMVWTADATGRGDYYNEQWLDFTGATLEESIALGWRPYVHPEDYAPCRAAWDISIATGCPYEIEVRMRSKKDQTYRWYLTRGVALRDEQGLVTRWFGTNTDIHEYKNLTEQLTAAKIEADQATAAKSAFLANMSHEIRTPLAAILGFTDLLADPNIEDQEKAEFYQIISRSGKSLSRIIDDILDLSKVEAGKLAVEHFEFSLNPIIEDVLLLFQETTRAKGISLCSDLDRTQDILITSDPTRLRQILINLVGNAVKFTLVGQVLVKVKTEFHSGGYDRPRLVIAVEDTGVGLSQEQAKNLFEPFHQADNSTTRKFGGSGLGLALSKRLAQALGGDVGLSEFALGKGSTFEFSLETEFRRISKGSESTVQSPSEQDKDPGSLWDQKLVGLLVEDAPENQFLLTKILTSRGIKIEIAGDGAEGIERAMNGTHDFILMDMQMPIVDGYEATRQLRSKGYKKPIIALTAHALAEERNRILECGCDVHLTKPIEINRLLAAIRFYCLS